jgi:hypothetical protein
MVGTRHLFIMLVALVLVTSANASMFGEYNPTGCNLNTHRYDSGEAIREPIACLDVANYEGKVVVLIRNQGDETLTISGAVLQPGYNYGYTYYDDTSGQQKQQQPAACPLNADVNKDGVAEPLPGHQLEPGDSLVMIGQGCQVATDTYYYNSLRIMYVEPNGIPHVAEGSAYSSPATKVGTTSPSALVFVPLVLLIIILVLILISAMRSRQKTVTLEGKQ